MKRKRSFFLWPNEKAAVVVTGASSGIGQACAMALNAPGGSVFAGVRREADAQRLRSQASDRLTPASAGRRRPGGDRRTARHVAEAVGKAGVAGLVNNAGIAVAGPLEIVPLAELRKQLEVNVIAPIAVTQAFLPLLRKTSGRIVNMSSVSGRFAAHILGPYAASKFALEALSDSLHRIEKLGHPRRPDRARKHRHADLGEESSRRPRSWKRRPSGSWQRRIARTWTRCAAVQHAADTALPVERVVRAVLAVTARRPKTRYPVGLETHLAMRIFLGFPIGCGIGVCGSGSGCRKGAANWDWKGVSEGDSPPVIAVSHCRIRECPGGDSNSHPLRDKILSLACLPIPPPGRSNIPPPDSILPPLLPPDDWNG